MASKKLFAQKADVLNKISVNMVLYTYDPD